MSKREWLRKSSIKQNESRMIMILSEYGFEVGVGTNCQICNNGRNNDYDIYLSYGIKNYRIEIDKDNLTYNLLVESLASNPKQKPKYHCIKEFAGCTTIENILNFIKRGTNYSMAC